MLQEEVLETKLLLDWSHSVNHKFLCIS